MFVASHLFIFGFALQWLMFNVGNIWFDLGSVAPNFFWKHGCPKAIGLLPSTELTNLVLPMCKQLLMHTELCELIELIKS